MRPPAAPEDDVGAGAAAAGDGGAAGASGTAPKRGGMKRKAKLVLPEGQAINSVFRGVSWHKKTQKWRAHMKITRDKTKKMVHLGYFDTEEAAAHAYDKACIWLHSQPWHTHILTTNFSTDEYDQVELARLMPLGQDELLAALRPQRETASKYRGVTRSSKVSGGWVATIRYGKKPIFLGKHDDEEAAARIYDKACLALYPDAAQTNFPRADYDMTQFAGMTAEQIESSLRAEVPRKRNVPKRVDAVTAPPAPAGASGGPDVVTVSVNHPGVLAGLLHAD